MTETLIIRSLILVDDDGHFNTFALSSQRGAIYQFLVHNLTHRDRINLSAEEIKEGVLHEDYEEFLSFLQEHILQRGFAELGDIRHNLDDDPF